jgi:hypothetical protein
MCVARTHYLVRLSSLKVPLPNQRVRAPMTIVKPSASDHRANVYGYRMYGRSGCEEEYCGHVRELYTARQGCDDALTASSVSAKCRLVNLMIKEQDVVNLSDRTDRLFYNYSLCAAQLLYKYEY